MTTEANALLQWVLKHNPNPPDPALSLILQLNDPALSQKAVAAGLNHQVSVAQANLEYLSELQKIAGAQK